MQNANLADFDEAESQGRFRAVLLGFGFPRVPFWRRTWIVAAGLACFLGIVILSILLATEFRMTFKDAATTALGLFTLAFAFHQWRAIRQEASLDKFYERLGAANLSYEKLDEADKYLMYMFAELDNLEYVIHKYKRSYISDELAFRALRTFFTHCRDIRHKDKDGTLVPLAKVASEWVERAGYLRPTRIVVRNVYREIELAAVLKQPHAASACSGDVR